MAWDAGSIESRLDVDTSPFRHGLDEAKVKAQEFADHRYTTTIDIDTKRSGEELAAVEQRLRSIESSVDRIGTKTGGGGRGGGGGFLSRLGGLPNPSSMMLGLGAAVPAAVPLAGVGLGVGAGAFSALSAGGLGALAFGAGAKSSITTVQKDVASLTKLTQQYNLAATDKQRAAVLAKEHALWKSLDPAQRGAVKNVQALEGAWGRYKKALEPQSFKVLADGSKLATTGLGYLLPVAKATGNEIDVLLRHAETAFKAPFWHQFFGSFLPGEATKATAAFGTTLGNLITAGAHLVQDFAPLGHDFEGGLVNLSKRFESWTEGAGPGKFVAFVEKEGPTVATTLGALAQGIAGLGKGFAPIGAIELKALTPVLSFIGKLGDEHPEVITAIGAALLTVGAGLKAISLAAGAAGILGKLRGVGGGGFGGGGVAGELTGRGSPTNPMYVIVLDKGLPGGTKVPGPLRVLRKIPIIGAVVGAAAVGADEITRHGNESSVSRLTKVAQEPGGVAALQHQYAETKALLDHVGSLDSVTGKVLNNALGQISTALKSVGASVQPAAVAGGQATAQSYNNAFAHDLRTKLLATAGPGARAGISAIVKNAAQDADNGGVSVGEQLMNGVARGIDRAKAAAILGAGHATAQVIATMNKQAGIASPSTKTTYTGQMLAAGIAVGFTGYSAQLLKAVGSTTAKLLTSLGTQLNNAANQYRSDLQARSAAGASIASGLLGNADLSNIGFSNTGGVGLSSSNKNLIGQFTQEKTLLDKLRAKHLDPDYLTQIAGMAPDRGIFVAQDILSGGEGSIGSLNSQRRQLRSLTNAIGGGVADAQYAGTLSRDARALEHVARSIELLVGKQLRLSQGDMQTLAREIATQIADVFPTIPLSEIDRALGLKVRAHR